MSKHDDIVARLRALASEFPTLDGIMDSEWTNAADEIERLRAERDEARRDRCMARAVIRWDIEHPNSPQRSETTIILLAWQIADEEGWDCFKGRKR